MTGHAKVTAVFVLAAGLVTATLEAQRAKKTGPTPAAGGATTAEAAPRYGGEVLEITTDVLDRFVQGLAAEETSRRAIAAKAAAAKTPADYEQCKGGVVMGPEGLKLLQDYTAAIGDGSGGPAVVQKAAATMTAKLDALVEKSCGPDPAKVSSNVPNQLKEAAAAAARAQGFTPRQFAILKERVTPLCLSDPSRPRGADVKVPGQGDAFYVYTAAEIEVLRPRCEALLKALVPPKT
jgi:hypothetical protein